MRQQDKGAPPPYDPPVARFARWVRLWSLHPLRSLHPPPRSPPPSLKYAPYSESLPGVRPPPESALPPWGPLFLPGALPSFLESALVPEVRSLPRSTPPSLECAPSPESYPLLEFTLPPRSSPFLPGVRPPPRSLLHSPESASLPKVRRCDQVRPGTSYHRIPTTFLCPFP